MNKFTFFKMLKFGLVGGVGLMVDFLFTWTFKDFFGFNSYIAHILGFLFAVGNNYFLNKYWTFNERKKISHVQFGKFFFVSIVGLVISTFILFIMYNYMNIDFYVSKIISTGIVSVWNYLINRFWVFNKLQTVPNNTI